MVVITKEMRAKVTFALEMRKEKREASSCSRKWDCLGRPPSIERHTRIWQGHIWYEITAYVDKYKIEEIGGVKIKEMLIWVSLNEMSIDNPVDGRIAFKGLAGLYRTYPFSAFDNPEVKIQLEYKLPPKIIDNVEVAEEVKEAMVAEEVKEAMVAKEVKDPIVAKEVKEPMAVIKKVEEPIVAKEVINL
ncbi:hypothetical protein IFM89_037447 [Coptis chinensis]|uniref:Uncharacterized protein n=1 Tax=Coptis chinensis TaxID=261450 RepID=A0A835LUD0_9MAGN|nr:hypothetical protein IFM89_037447 [Coptis chinensis]